MAPYRNREHSGGNSHNLPKLTEFMETDHARPFWFSAIIRTVSSAVHQQIIQFIPRIFRFIGSWLLLNHQINTLGSKTN